MSLDHVLSCDDKRDSVGTTWVFFGGSGTAQIRYFSIGNGGIADGNFFRSGAWGITRREYRRHTIFGFITSGPPMTVSYTIANVAISEIDLVMPNGVIVFVETPLLFGVIRELPFSFYRGQMDYGQPIVNGFLLMSSALTMDVLRL